MMCYRGLLKQKTAIDNDTWDIDQHLWIIANKKRHIELLLAFMFGTYFDQYILIIERKVPRPLVLMRYVYT